MATETLAAVYQDTVRLYGQLATHTIDAYFGVAQRALQGVGTGLSTVLNNDRVAIADGVKSRVESAHRAVSGAIDGGVTKARSDAHGLIGNAVSVASNGIDAAVGLAGRLETRFPRMSAAATPAIQASLPVAKLTRGVVQVVAGSVERIADRLSVEPAPAARAKKTAKRATATVRKTARKAQGAAKSAGRRARKAVAE